MRDYTWQLFRLRLGSFLINFGKASGLDGISIEPEVIKMVQKFWVLGTFDSKLNKTNIFLVPKKITPKGYDQFQPISLCNICYKIISKIFCLRLQKILSQIVLETQSAFVAERVISDNIMLSQEAFHALSTQDQCKKDYMAIKTKMDKVYDRVEWNFL